MALAGKDSETVGGHGEDDTHFLFADGRHDVRNL
jgi:hypothetical protein